jgi:hypothetical protein
VHGPSAPCLRFLWFAFFDDLKAVLEDLLDIETQDAETFETEPLDAQVARLCRVLGLPSPLA